MRHRLFPVENLLPWQLWWDLRFSTHNFIPRSDIWGQELVCYYQKVQLSQIMIIWAKITNNGYEYPCTVAVTKRRRRASIRILLWPDISIGNTGVHETSHLIVHHTLSCDSWRGLQMRWFWLSAYNHKNLVETKLNKKAKFHDCFQNHLVSADGLNLTSLLVQYDTLNPQKQIQIENAKFRVKKRRKTKIWLKHQIVRNRRGSLIDPL